MLGAILMAAAGRAPGLINGVPNGDSSIGGGGLGINADGTYTISDGAGTDEGDWVTPATEAIAALYQVKIDVTSGSFDTGTTGSFVDCSTGPAWSCSATVVFDVAWREKATGVVRLTQAGRTIVVTGP